MALARLLITALGGVVVGGAAIGVGIREYLNKSSKLVTQETVKSLEKGLSEKDHLIVEQNNKIEQLEYELQESYKNLWEAESNKKLLEEKTKKLEQEKQALVQLKEQLKDLEKVNSEKEKLSQDVSRKNSEIEQKNKEIQQQKEKIAEKETELSALAKVKDEFEQLKRQNEELQRQSQNSQEVKELKEKLQKLEDFQKIYSELLKQANGDSSKLQALDQYMDSVKSFALYKRNTTVQLKANVADTLVKLKNSMNLFENNDLRVKELQTEIAKIEKWIPLLRENNS
ncbi:hypothetical protein OVS_02285 [Mycoplasma ovis str. Michigan]|uniref:Chromosome partition protein Smc n=1 Tax=Mycoplasma ovis str. Michigan TaxID=1415773 RepID=A0ABM5P1F0_9MOLU|nr:hypothetical protein [Mycoplasma ovis]AHC40313.1 hypothetical protein OVS_02285 [Mycoplasma ovis str. Michigan]